MRNRGFTLIELLVAMTIVAVLMGLELFSLQGSRKAARDSKRKADLEQIRSALEVYRSDCGTYPNLSELSGELTGSSVEEGAVCSVDDVYLSEVPTDPLAPSKLYSYTYNATTNSYTLCASLENSTSSVSGCGSCGDGQTCNYKVTSP